MSVTQSAPPADAAKAQGLPSLLQLMFSPAIGGQALKVSAVVGTVLNLINNGPQWWQFHTVNLWQALLNYLVPFCVSAYSAARNERGHGRNR